MNCREQFLVLLVWRVASPLLDPAGVAKILVVTPQTPLAYTELVPTL